MNDAPTADDRERRLIDALVSLAKSFREERDRLSQRLARLEHEIDALASGWTRISARLPE